MTLPSLFESKIAVVGMGYVGLPLAIQMSKTKNCLVTGNKRNHTIIGFDTNVERIKELKNGIDKTNEVTSEELIKAKNFIYSHEVTSLEQVDVFIVTVPTPIDKNNLPDLEPIKKACETIGKVIQKRKANMLIKPMIIFESTVYPGTTEEICVPIIEKFSKKIFNEDFFVGYSPERVNPGDKNHSLNKIVKVTSGSNSEVADWVYHFYASIINAGVFKAASIMVAEAAKVIENTQRDLNIALVNELSIIFNKLGLDTQDILAAARTKWNFLDFRPGLVGGHCIGVDPYYLTYKAKQIGYNPKVILSGRETNEEMGKWIVEQFLKKFNTLKKEENDIPVTIFGFTFKENCPDIRNTGTLNLVRNLKKKGISPTIIDPKVDKKEAKNHYGLDILNKIPEKIKDNAIILTVPHDEFKNLNWPKIIKDNVLVFDIKGIVPRDKKVVRI